EAVDETAQRAEEGLALVRGGATDDDTLAAAQVDPGRGVLVGHAAGQAQRILDRVHLRGIGPHAAATGRGPQRGVVEGDDRPQARLLLLAEVQVLVIKLRHIGKDAIHALPPSATVVARVWYPMRIQ